MWLEFFLPAAPPCGVGLGRQGSGLGSQSPWAGQHLLQSSLIPKPPLGLSLPTWEQLAESGVSQVFPFPPCSWHLLSGHWSSHSSGGPGAEGGPHRTSPATPPLTAPSSCSSWALDRFSGPGRRAPSGSASSPGSSPARSWAGGPGALSAFPGTRPLEMLKPCQTIFVGDLLALLSREGPERRGAVTGPPPSGAGGRGQGVWLSHGIFPWPHP